MGIETQAMEVGDKNIVIEVLNCCMHSHAGVLER